jgi:hypothetical protein
MPQPILSITTIQDGDRQVLWGSLLLELEAAVSAVITARRDQLTDAGLYLAAHELRLELSDVLLDGAEGG